LRGVLAETGVMDRRRPPRAHTRVPGEVGRHPGGRRRFELERAAVERERVAPRHRVNLYRTRTVTASAQGRPRAVTSARRSWWSWLASRRAVASGCSAQRRPPWRRAG